MNDLADDGFHEIQLSGKQLVFLFIVTTVVAVVIFLCGVQVGRGVKSDRPGEVADNVAAAGPTPEATPPTQPAAAGGPPAAEQPAPVAEPDDELSYAKRLQADQGAPAIEKLKSPSSGSQAAKAAVPAVPPSVAKPEPVPAATAQDAGRAGGWIVQITAMKDRNACAGIAQRLTAKGYPAFVQDPAPGSPKIYRVHVGGYPDRDKAEQAARRLATEEQFKTYVRSR